MTQPPSADEGWRQVLTDPGQARQARWFRHMPSNPRCPICLAPHGLPFGPIMGRLGFGRSKRYPQLCNPCFREIEKNRGGAEVPLTILVADVRGSTAIAEQRSAEEFKQLLEGFYAKVTSATRDEGGLIDKFLGDGVMALFIPAFTNVRHAAHGLAAGRRILAEAALPVGVGVNTGVAFTGFLGPSQEVASFTAVGDAVNVAHRLGEAAAAGELLVSAETATQAELPASQGGEPWTRRTIPVKGREEPAEVWSIRTPPTERAAA